MASGAAGTGGPDMARYSPVRTGNAVVDRNLDAIASSISTSSVSYTQTLVSAFLNGWSALVGVQAPGYRLWSTGEVELFGGLTGGTSGVAALVLPSSLAPAATRQWGTAGWNGSAPVACLVKLDTLGNVILVVNSNNQAFLDGVRWVAGA